MAAGERALARFAGLARSIGVSRLRAVATAAVRQASNGPDFVDRVNRATGLRIEVLSGDAEAAASASGVIAGIQGVDGIVGDLGGGLLAHVSVAGGKVHERMSLSFGSLGVTDRRARGRSALECGL